MKNYPKTLVDLEFRQIELRQEEEHLKFMLFMTLVMTVFLMIFLMLMVGQGM